MLSEYKLVLWRVDYHALWVNKMVISMIQDPIIDNDAQIIKNNGEMTGVFLDDAMKLVETLVSNYSQKDSVKAFKAASKRMLENGLVGLHDAGVNPDKLDLLQRLYANNEIPIRNYAMITCKIATEQCSRMKIHHKNGPKHKFTVSSVKLFLDGALGSWGAAMLEVLYLLIKDSKL